MDALPPALLRLSRDARARSVLAGLAAALYYVVAVATDAGRGHAALLIALPCALVLIWWRSRPLLAELLSAVGILAVLIALGAQLESTIVVTQYSVLAAIFGGALAESTVARRGAAALCAGEAVVAVVLSGSVVLGVLIGLACALPLAAGWGWRQLQQSTRMGAELAESAALRRDAEREIAVEQERNRVAREVHDIVAHSLAVVAMQAEGARFAARNDPAAVDATLAGIAETARGSLTEVRSLLAELRHRQSSAPAPSLTDLDTLVDGMRELGLTIDIANYGRQRTIGEAAQLAVYRIVQEALTNALRHGDAGAPVEIDFDWGERSVAVTVTNALRPDGVPQIDGPGHGIPGMRERAALAGGDVVVGVGTRGRFRVRVQLPLPRRLDDEPVAPPRVAWSIADGAPGPAARDARRSDA